ncbi:hypothetical protein [Paenibacillus sp. FSL H3-0333]|uniref:hypothetical protein n=1 Tax=Paenibacillus sp. FSL H3-0333 TaxID=2921373 RepID=UPI0030FBD651
MKFIESHLPFFSLLITTTLALSNLTLAIMKELRDKRKEKNERLQQESAQIENGAYPLRKDRHRKR